MEKENLAKLGYHLLMVLSIIDGSYDDQEVDVIVGFLEDEYPGRINIDEENQVLEAVPTERMNEYVMSTAKSFARLSEMPERKRLMKFAVDLVVADGDLADEEYRTLRAVGEFMDVDVQAIFRERVSNR